MNDKRRGTERGIAKILTRNGAANVDLSSQAVEDPTREF
jgi:hypothetical protein